MSSFALRALALAALAALAAPPAAACPAGAKCLTVPERQRTVQVSRAAFLPAAVAEPAPYAVGDVIPADRVQVLLNTAYHGLPPSDGSFWYVRAGSRVYRMDPSTLEVLGTVE